MKMTNLFQDQVTIVLEWFSTRNQCEQVVVLYSFLRRISSTHLRFLSQVFDQLLLGCAELKEQEKQANDPAFIGSLFKESKSIAVSQLLQSLLLLRPGNDAAKSEYMQLVPQVMTHSLENGCHLEECRHLLSYLIIHPAFSRFEFPQRSLWQTKLSDAAATPQGVAVTRVPTASSQALHTQLASANGGVGIPGGSVNFGPERDGLPYINVPSNLGLSVNLLSAMGNSFNNYTLMSIGRDSGVGESERGSTMNAIPVGRALRSSSSMPLQDIHRTDDKSSSAGQLSASHVTSTRGHQKLAHTSPVVNSVSGIGPTIVNDWLNRNHDNVGMMKSHNLSINNPDSLHAPLSPQSSITSSGSGGSDAAAHPDELRRSQNTSMEDDDDGMRDVSGWLKSLRLHKYSTLFQRISYEEMLTITEEWLEQQKVTKGARNKILLSLKKLQDRQENLRSLEKDLMALGSIKETILEVVQMLKTPMKHFSSLKSKPRSMSSASQMTDKTPVTVTMGATDTSLIVSEGDSIPEGDLPGQITRLIGKICTQLLVSVSPDSECLSDYLQLLDKSFHHQAFTKDQKKKMVSWRNQILRLCQINLMQKQNIEQHRMNFAMVGHQLGVIPGKQRALRGQQQPITSPSHLTWSFGNATICPPVQNVAVSPALSGPLPPVSSPHFHNRSSISTALLSPSTIELSPSGKQLLGRTKSAPIRPAPQIGLSLVATPATCEEMLSMNDDIHASLDSLCISMTEHALELEGEFGESL